MAFTETNDIILRPKRQVTLPRQICDRLGLKPGDVLELSIEDSALVAKPRKTRSLSALEEIQQAFKRSGVSEKELRESGRRLRREIVKEQYGDQT
jgi:AbrB family looped-hinge helix DNA binding protein